jgi:hypothetical protein
MGTGVLPVGHLEDTLEDTLEDMLEYSLES